MKCSNCGGPVRLTHRPGIFLAIATVAVIAALAIAVGFPSFSGWIIAGAIGFLALIASGGVYTEMIDASIWVFSKSKRLGVECKKCGKVNRIYPWSL